MQDLLLQYVTKTAGLHIIIIACEVCFLCGAMTIDFFSGLHKAKINGIARNSRKLKMTAKKAHRYFSPLAVLVFIDLLTAICLPAPFFSILYTAYLLYCEYSSIKEKAWEKAEIERAARTINMIIENREDMAKTIAELITKQNITHDDQQNTP